MELVDFLRARLDEDERELRELSGLVARVEWLSDRAMRLEREMERRISRVEQAEVMRLMKPEPDGLTWLEGTQMRGTALDPARVLAEVEAKRALLDRYETQHWHGPAAPTSPDPRDHVEETGACRTCVTARILARVYRDHPDFDPAWLDR